MSEEDKRKTRKAGKASYDFTQDKIIKNLTLLDRNQAASRKKGSDKAGPSTTPVVDLTQESDSETISPSAPVEEELESEDEFFDTKTPRASLDFNQLKFSPPLENPNQEVPVFEIPENPNYFIASIH